MRTTRDRGNITLLVLVKFWTKPKQIEGILGKIREEDHVGSLQIDFGDVPKAILRRGAGLWKAFVWDLEIAKLLPRGDNLSFGYDFSTRVPGPWLGGSTVRDGGTAHVTIVAVIGQQEGAVQNALVWEESDLGNMQEGRYGEPGIWV